MKIFAVSLFIIGLDYLFDGDFASSLLTIGISAFIFRKYKYQKWCPQKSETKTKQPKEKKKSRKKKKKEHKKLEADKIKALNNSHVFRKFNVSGVTHDGRQKMLYSIVRKHGSEGAGKISFISELDNQYDPNAIKIDFEDIGVLGYIPKERAVEIASILEKRAYDIKWNISFFDKNKGEGIAYMEIRLY